MGKDKEKLFLEGYDFFFWNYEEQTKMKHFVFKEYFDKWVKILGHYHKLNYFDCFAGSGAYIDNNRNIYFGSPILAAETIQENIQLLGRNTSIYIIDTVSENIENMKKIIEYKKLKIQPIYIIDEFDNAINVLIDKMNGNLSPSFFFIDPFGFSIKYSTLKRIIQIPKSEIFLNFMFTRVNQFLIDNIETTLNGLFGCSVWKDFKTLSGTDREKNIVNLYKTQLKKISKYVYPYRICFPDKQRTYYYLVHLTNHYLGCSIMKSSFAKFNDGEVEYTGGDSGDWLFKRDKLRIEQIKDFLLKTYYNKDSMELSEILSENIDSTPFLESEIKKSIQLLEEDEKIYIKRLPPLTPTGKKRKSIYLNDQICFNR